MILLATGEDVAVASERILHHRILVADDDPVIRTLLSEALSGAGHTVEAFQDGQAALKGAGAARLSLLLLDLEMPGRRGSDVLL
jgi:CheY-like chemotaxis protein